MMQRSRASSVDTSSTSRPFALAAAIRAIAFAALSTIWALGFDVGGDQLALVVQEQAGRRERSFVMLLWLTVILKWPSALSHYAWGGGSYCRSRDA